MKAGNFNAIYEVDWCRGILIDVINTCTCTCRVCTCDVINTCTCRVCTCDVHVHVEYVHVLKFSSATINIKNH